MQQHFAHSTPVRAEYITCLCMPVFAWVYSRLRGTCHIHQLIMLITWYTLTPCSQKMGGVHQFCNTCIYCYPLPNGKLRVEIVVNPTLRNKKKSEIHGFYSKTKDPIGIRDVFDAEIHCASRIVLWHLSAKSSTPCIMIQHNRIQHVLMPNKISAFSPSSAGRFRAEICSASLFVMRYVVLLADEIFAHNDSPTVRGLRTYNVIVFLCG